MLYEIIAASAAPAPTISAMLTTKIQKLITTERIPPVPMFKRGHDARSGIVTLSQFTHYLWGEYPFGESANQSGKLLRKFERKLGRTQIGVEPKLTVPVDDLQ